VSSEAARGSCQRRAALQIWCSAAGGGAGLSINLKAVRCLTQGATQARPHPSQVPTSSWCDLEVSTSCGCDLHSSCERRIHTLVRAERLSGPNSQSPITGASCLVRLRFSPIRPGSLLPYLPDRPRILSLPCAWIRRPGQSHHRMHHHGTTGISPTLVAIYV